jgi:hypothetical protein
VIRDDAVYLRHILDAINQIEEYVAGLPSALPATGRWLPTGGHNGRR